MTYPPSPWSRPNREDPWASGGGAGAPQRARSEDSWWQGYGYAQPAPVDESQQEFGYGPRPTGQGQPGFSPGPQPPGQPPALDAPGERIFDAPGTRGLDASGTRVFDGPAGPVFGAPGTPDNGPAPRRAADRPSSPRWWPAVVVATVVSLVVGAGAGFGAAYLRTTPTESTAAPAQAVVPPTGEDTVRVAERLLESTVTIAYRSNTTGGTGSGFVIDDAGHIITNNHVIEGAANGRTELMVEFTDGQRVRAHIVGRSPSYDLAVIRVDRPRLTPVEFGDSSAVRPGQGVLAVGAPLGLGGSITAGIVSAVDRPFGVGDDATSDDAVRTYINGIQTDASINPGNSGGPLADSAGRVIGVNSAILTLGGSTTGRSGGNIGLGFAIPMNQARVIADEILRDGHATYPVIGAAVSPNTDGVRLSDVTPGGPAAAAGLKSGDVVLAVGGRSVDTPTDLIVRVRSHRPGQVVELTIRDRGPVQVTLGEKVG